MRASNYVIAIVLTAMQFACASHANAATKSWTLDVREQMRDRLVQIPISFDDTYDASKLAVVEDGKRVACQVEVIKGTAAQVVEGKIWVCVTARPGDTRKFEVTTGAEAQKFEHKVKVSKEGEEWILDNGLLAVKLPAAVGKLAGPIGAVKVGEKWIGESHWQSSTVFNSLQSRLTGDGTLFGQVELLYIFNDPTYGGRIPFASVTVRMPPERPYVIVEESMAMEEGDRWVLRLDDLLQTVPLRPEEWEHAADARIGELKRGTLVFPTRRGTRRWMLLAGERGPEKEPE